MARSARANRRETVDSTHHSTGCGSKDSTPAPAGVLCIREPLWLGAPGRHGRSNLSRFITFVHAATKSCTNFSRPSDEA